MIESPIGEYVLYSAHINTVDQFNKLKIKHDKLKEENTKLIMEIKKLKEN